MGYYTNFSLNQRNNFDNSPAPNASFFPSSGYYNGLSNNNFMPQQNLMINNYYNESREKGRQMVNEWIRTSGEYDGVIDFDAATRDPEQPDRLNPAFLFENDWLHPNAIGYQKMGESIDLNLFTR